MFVGSGSAGENVTEVSIWEWFMVSLKPWCVGWTLHLNQDWTQMIFHFWMLPISFKILKYGDSNQYFWITLIEGAVVLPNESGAPCRLVARFWIKISCYDILTNVLKFHEMRILYLCSQSNIVHPQIFIQQTDHFRIWVFEHFRNPWWSVCLCRMRSTIPA